MNTTENDKLIAEFLEWKFKPNFNCYVIPFNYVDYLDGTPFINKICHVENLQFNTDWNWLMQVVEKIETTSYNVPENIQRGYMKNTLKATGVINSYYNDRSEFLGWSSSAWLGTKTIFDSTMLGEDIERYNTKIEAVYNACVEFIKWYNEQNK